MNNDYESLDFRQPALEQPVVPAASHEAWRRWSGSTVKDLNRPSRDFRRVAEAATSALKTAPDFESLGTVDGNRQRPFIIEQYQGTEIVKWHGKIERQLVGLVQDNEKARNFPYADKLREFLKTWREHELTGSINVETIEALETASRMLSVDTWNLASYFSSLGTQLKVLKASEEQLPRGMDMGQNEPFAGGGGAGGGAPPMSPAFGPDEEAPEGEGGLGGEGGPGGGGGGGMGGPGDMGGPPQPPPAPGEEGAVPGAEGAPGEEMPASPTGELPPETAGVGNDTELDRLEPEEGPPEEGVRRV